MQVVFLCSFRRSNTVKIFISQPMRNKSIAQIKAERAHAVSIIMKQYPYEEIEILNTVFEEEAGYIKAPLYYLGRSIMELGKADGVYFIGEWQKYRGCRVENFIAKQYGIKIIKE